MYVYLTPMPQTVVNPTLDRVRQHCEISVEFVPATADRERVRAVVAKLSRPNYKGLLLPDDFRLHSPVIEMVKMCAHQMGMHVMPLGHFFSMNERSSAAAAAVPPTQQRAAVDVTH